MSHPTPPGAPLGEHHTHDVVRWAPGRRAGDLATALGDVVGGDQ